MKGLLYKDFCMIKKYCKIYLFITVLFLFMSISNQNISFYVFYPCLIAGMLPTNLLSYDERSRWTDYSKTLPYSSSDIVSGKFIVGLLATLIIVVINALCQSLINHTEDIVMVSAVMIVIALIISSAPLTFMFKYGVEKGRIAYYIMLGIFAAFLVEMPWFFGDIEGEGLTSIKIDETLLAILIIVIGISIYLLLWRLSIKFYSKNKD